MVSKQGRSTGTTGSDGRSTVGRRATYHHGDLRAALVTAALELVAEKGVPGLSVAEAARRAGVSSAAPYRHFSSRTALLSAAATVAGRRLSEQMRSAVEKMRASGAGVSDPVTQAVETLAALATVYVRFALVHGAAFELILADELQEFPTRSDATSPGHCSTSCCGRPLPSPATCTRPIRCYAASPP